MKQGFTLIEVLVASVLMGMMITILTMVFNSSSIAWRTGKAGVLELNNRRNQVALYARLADDALPFVSSANRSALALNASAWRFSKGSGSAALRARALITSSGGDAESGERACASKMESLFGSRLREADRSRAWQGSVAIDRAKSEGGAKAYVVGVTSAGPNGVFDDEDDITTWPEDL